MPARASFSRIASIGIFQKLFNDVDVYNDKCYTFKRETKERLFRSIFNLFNRPNFAWIHSFIQGTAGTVLYSIYNICIIIVLANNVEVRTYASVVEGEKGI